MIKRTPADRNRVALRNALADNDLLKRSENAYPPYGEFLWDRMAREFQA